MYPIPTATSGEAPALAVCPTNTNKPTEDLANFRFLTLQICKFDNLTYRRTRILGVKTLTPGYRHELEL
jgi:hypothetical protein